VGQETMVQVTGVTKTSQAYRRIKGLIEEGRLEAGERVTEAKVSKLVGMKSRAGCGNRFYAWRPKAC